MSLVCYNGKLISENQPLFTAKNRGYRYGDGFFETMRVVNGRFPLLDYHLQRIEFSFQLLQYQPPATKVTKIIEQALELCAENNCMKNARVRLSFSNGNGPVFHPNTEMDYLIEASPLDESYNKLNEKGLATGISSLAKKSCDDYANLKSANFLPYRIAADFASKNNWNDAFVLNQYENIIETTIANIFWIKDELIFTPPLSEGCVKGTMRSYLLNTSKGSDFQIIEKKCTPDDLHRAEEIFVTNAVSGLRWVQQFEGKQYSNPIAKKIYGLLVAPLWAS